MPDSTAPVTTDASLSSTEANPAASDQLNEELKKPRRVLKTHRKSIDESKGASSSKPISSLDEEEFSITTDSLKEMLSVPQKHEIEKSQNDSCANKSIQKTEGNDQNESENNELVCPVPPPEHEPTSTLYIKNFVRPLTLQMVRELLQKFGEIDFFWMDKIKSHCYIKYKSLESAVTARKSLWHVTFPPDTGRPLELEFLAFEKAQKLISEAEEKTSKSDSKYNGNNSGTVDMAPTIPQNINRVTPEFIFPRTTTKPSLFYKTIPQEDAEAKMRIMERRRGMHRT